MLAVVPVALPVTVSGTVNAPVIPTGAELNVTVAFVYPEPPLVTSINLTLLYPEPPFTILIAVNVPLVNVGVNVASIPGISGELTTRDTLSSS